MTEHKYTDEEVIKALECCSDCECYNATAQEDCPLINMPFCKNYMRKQALDLINRQKSEIESLKDLNKQLDIDNFNANMNLETTQYDLDLLKQEKAVVVAKAIKEFAEKLEDFEEVVTSLKDGAPTTAVEVYYIHKLVEEFTEEKT